MTGSINYIMEIFMDAQTELIFFGLAFATHVLFVRGMKWTRPAKKGKDVLSSVKQSGSQKDPAFTNSVAALKAAIRANDVKSAMQHLEGLRGLWAKSSPSPSSAPQILMEQIVKLAIKTGALSELLQLLAKNELLQQAFDIVLGECAEQNDAKSATKVEQLGRAHNVQFTSSTYQALIRAAGKNGTQADAKSLLSEAQKCGMADSGTYNAYMSVSLKFGNSREVQSAMKSMRTADLQFNVVAFNKLLGVALSSDAGAVWGIVDEMQAFGVAPDQTTCTILLKSRCVSSSTANLEKVIKMVDALGSDIDEVLFCSIVEACVRIGRADLLMPFLQKQHGVNVKGAHTFASIIRAYGYVQDVKGVWATWRSMRKQQVAPISVTLGCMVEALVTNGDIEGGYELIQEMLQDEKTAPLVNAVMYGSIVKGFSHKKNFGRMWEVYDEMVSQKLQFSMVTYNTLIDACARSGELDRIPSLLKDVQTQGLEMGIVTYSAILKGYCQKNLLDEAFELFSDMKRNTKLEPDEIMYNTLLDGCARQGLYDRGMTVFDMMNEAGVRPSNYTLSVLVKLANRGKKLEKAFELCDEVSSKYGFRLNVHVFDNLIQACINHRDLQRAIGVVCRMLQERVRPDARSYSLLLRACIDSKSAKDADGLLRSAMGLKDSHPRLAMYSVAAAKLQGGLPSDVISETLLGLADICREERLAATLFCELGRSSRGLHLDSKLKLRFAARMNELR